MSAGISVDVTTSVWLHEIRAAGDKRFVFFPPAGSSASAAWKFSAALPQAWSVSAVQYPARGPRLREPVAESVRELALGTCPALGDCSQTLLFGHSFGAFVAYDVAQILAAQGNPPLGLIVSGMPCPRVRLRHISPDDVSDASLIRSLDRGGATAEELLLNEELMEMVLPVLRADLAMARSYQDDHGELDLPVLTLAGRDDPLVTAAQLAAWRQVTTRWLGCERPPGEHFFYNENPSSLADAVARHWPYPDGES